MRTSHLIAGAIAAAAIFAAPPAFATTVFQQAFTSGGTGSDYNAQQLADNFTLGANATIGEVDWTGVYGGPGSVPAGTATFEILFFTGSGNIPVGSAFASYTASVSTAGVTLGTYHDYSFILPTVLNLTAGTRYWIEIANDSGPGHDGFFWGHATNSNPSDAVRFSPSSGWTADGFTHLAFALQTGTPAVPEPTSALLMGAGVASLLARRARRRA
jgi:hypothetical protein